MTRHSFAAIALIVLFGTAAAAAEAVKAAALALHPIESKLIEQTNAMRARHGMKPLVVSLQLVNSSRSHAAYMCRSRNFSHSNNNVAENIAMGQSTVDEAMRSWMNSPGHRANILNPRYTRIGVAAYRLGDGRPVYWCQQFIW